MQADLDTVHPMRQETPEDTFIAQMAQERRKRGWTLERIAEEVAGASGGEVRLHQSAFTKLEREHDRRNLRLNEAYYIAAALGTTISAMLAAGDLPAERLQAMQRSVDALFERRVQAQEAMGSIQDELRLLDAQIDQAIKDFAKALQDAMERGDVSGGDVRRWMEQWVPETLRSERGDEGNV